MGGRSVGRYSRKMMVSSTATQKKQNDGCSWSLTQKCLRVRENETEKGKSERKEKKRSAALQLSDIINMVS